MYDIRKLIDPLMLGMKLRDSMNSRNPAHVQDYVLDVLKSSLNQTRGGQGELSRTPGNLNIQDAISNSLSQVQGVPGMGNPLYLQNYIQSVMEHSLGQAFGQPMGTVTSPGKSSNYRQNNRSANENAEVFETHDHIFVKIPIPEQADERLIDIHIGLNRVVLKWSPGGKEHIVQLPSDVKNDGAAASVKNRILEIKMPKEPNPDLKKVRITRD